MAFVDVHAALYSALTGSAELMVKVTGVFDTLPQEQASPYIVLGQLQALPGRLLNETENAWSVDIHIWSAHKGRKEVLEIADILRGVLSGYFFEELVVQEDPSGWFHGILTVRGYTR
jgi:hypothetical protein